MTTSNQQQIIQTGTSTSTDPEKSTMDIFKEIKLKNEALNINTYNQFSKKTSGAQSRLLSTFDTDKGRMLMEFLQAQVPQSK